MKITIAKWDSGGVAYTDYCLGNDGFERDQTDHDIYHFEFQESEIEARIKQKLAIFDEYKEIIQRQDLMNELYQVGYDFANNLITRSKFHQLIRKVAREKVIAELVDECRSSVRGMDGKDAL